MLMRSKLGSWPLTPSVRRSKWFTLSEFISKFIAAWIDPEWPSRGADVMSGVTSSQEMQYQQY